jgi:predicted site-specific integrase-resolvase
VDFTLVYKHSNNHSIPRLIKKDFDVLLVENKDRLTRFGFKWFEALSPFKIEVINVADNSRVLPIRKVSCRLKPLLSYSFEF